MKYYWISYSLAVTIKVTSYRLGNKDGYIVNTGDLTSVDIVREKASGNLSELTQEEAKKYIHEHKLN